MRNLKYFFAALIFLVCSCHLSAQEIQNSISGKITDYKIGEPLSNVNVYLAGTLIGTTTDKEGNYLITNVYPAEYELVVSMIGFEPKSKVIVVRRTSKLKHNFKLKERSYLMDDVVVKTEKPEEWYDDLEIFKRLFLGRTEFAHNCEIENELFLSFEHLDDDIFKVSIDRPLKIINNDLGFEILCELLRFTYNEEDFRLQYIIKPFFKQMEEREARDKERWEDNRLEAFEGSLDHFLKCLVNHDFGEKGYKVSITHQPSTFFAGAQPTVILKSEAILKPIAGSDLRTMSFPNYLQVVYMEGSLDYRPRSWLRLLIPEPTIDKYGYTTDLVPFETHGYWALLGVANMLPKYYYIN